MDWEQEKFVKLYTRDTPDWVVLSWEARALFLFLMRKVDRAGVLVTRHSFRGVAALVGMPVDVVERALTELIADGCVSLHDGGYELINFEEAQEARQGTAARQRAFRSRKRDADAASDPPPVTRSNAESREVTKVTTRLDQTRPDQTRPEEEGDTSGADALGHSHFEPQPVDSEVREESRSKPAPVAFEVLPMEPAPDPARAFAEAAVTALNDATGHNYRADSEAVLKAARALVAKRFTPADAVAVIEAKATAWGSDPKMAQYLCPKTLLRPSNFISYVDDLRAGNKPNARPRAAFPQRRSALEGVLDLIRSDESEEFHGSA